MFSGVLFDVFHFLLMFEDALLIASKWLAESVCFVCVCSGFIAKDAFAWGLINVRPLHMLSECVRVPGVSNAQSAAGVAIAGWSVEELGAAT